LIAVDTMTNERAMTGLHNAPDLGGARVRLEPLTTEHIAGLTAVGLDPDLWQWPQVRSLLETKLGPASDA
jgi:hypothetical protein